MSVDEMFLGLFCVFAEGYYIATRTMATSASSMPKPFVSVICS